MHDNKKFRTITFAFLCCLFRNTSRMGTIFERHFLVLATIFLPVHEAGHSCKNTTKNHVPIECDYGCCDTDCCPNLVVVILAPFLVGGAAIALGVIIKKCREKWREHKEFAAFEGARPGILNTQVPSTYKVLVPGNKSGMPSTKYGRPEMQIATISTTPSLQPQADRPPPPAYESLEVELNPTAPT